MRRLSSRWLALVGMAATALVFSLSPTGATLAAPSGGAVQPNATNMMDCHGWSPAYRPVKAALGGACADMIHVDADGSTYRFLDNGHYVGHDEPSVKFISDAPGSASTQTYLMRLAVDPAGTPTVTSTRVTKYAMLSVAPWFGLPICDPKSYPQNPCTPDSDTNSGDLRDPNAAGSAFLELQFYAPGFPPFIDGPSCDPTRYCAALTIDSVECTFGFATCNNNCIEPVNFAFLQMDGVPAGPPSPQLSNVSTFTPNRKTLMMNQGDVLAVTITDTSQGLLTRINDLSTGQSGFMVASASNGFMNTNIADCSGTPFTFRPEYSSAKQGNQVPWTALEAGVLMQQEIGHFEPCSSVTSQLPVQFDTPDGQSFSDPNVFQVCQGGLERGGTGEGPCDPATGLCVGSTTEGGVPCPTNDFTSGALCEFSDANCMPAGKRTIVVNGQRQSVRWPIAGCQDNAFQNGDLDFDGTSYRADWPDGQRGHPTAFQYLGPFDAQGHTYPQIQFESNAPASEILCNTRTGAGCTVPPVGAAFYPFWTLGSLGRGSGPLSNVCVWSFGNVIPGVTRLDFGRTAEYGTPNTARFAGTVTSAVVPNPQFDGSCRA
jgi:hypothetical protein